MPRTYKPGPKTRRRAVYKPEDIQAAVNDIEKVGMSYREAGKKYKIHWSVLYRHSKKHMKKLGGQTVLSQDEETSVIQHINVCAEWGYPIDSYELRMLVKHYLDKNGKEVKKFAKNMPGKEFASSFLRRHADQISKRNATNIKRSRASVNPEIIQKYFQNLEKTLEDVPATNVLNYDETNLCDDPGKKKVLTKRGAKYPERVMNHTKSATSLMMCVTASGEVLPPYVVYKAQGIYDTWTENGPSGARYNRTKSGWFDIKCFEDWAEKILFPYCQILPGKKVVIGDNLSSHMSLDLVQKGLEMDIHFAFLPANSTHLTQPLDVAFFGPMKKAWREILTQWKVGPGRKEATVSKCIFPRLLSKMLKKLEPNMEENVKAGFDKTGIVPLNPQKVLRRVPGGAESSDANGSNQNVSISDSLMEILKLNRYGDDALKPKKRKKLLAVSPGKSACNLFVGELEMGVEHEGRELVISKLNELRKRGCAVETLESKPSTSNNLSETEIESQVVVTSHSKKITNKTKSEDNAVLPQRKYARRVKMQFCKMCFTKKVFDRFWLKCIACKDMICAECSGQSMPFEFICTRCIINSDDSVDDEDYIPSDSH